MSVRASTSAVCRRVASISTRWPSLWAESSVFSRLSSKEEGDGDDVGYEDNISMAWRKRGAQVAKETIGDTLDPVPMNSRTFCHLIWMFLILQLFLLLYQPKRCNHSTKLLVAFVNQADGEARRACIVIDQHPCHFSASSKSGRAM